MSNADQRRGTAAAVQSGLPKARVVMDQSIASPRSNVTPMQPVVVASASPYVSSWLKRSVDLAIAVPMAVVAVPVVAVLALVMLVSLRSSPFFVQRRVGRDGRLFRMLKLRTLPARTPRDASKYDIADVTTTRAGRFLRKTHLDELPQVFQVVWGTMSLVGPRPEMPRLMAQFDPVEADFRSRARPGCTGLWQLSKDAGHLIYEVPQYDRAYVRDARLSLDLFLLWSTVRCTLHPGRFVACDHRLQDRFGLSVE